MKRALPPLGDHDTKHTDVVSDQVGHEKKYVVLAADDVRPPNVDSSGLYRSQSGSLAPCRLTLQYPDTLVILSNLRALEADNHVSQRDPLIARQFQVIDQQLATGVCDPVVFQKMVGDLSKDIDRVVGQRPDFQTFDDIYGFGGVGIAFDV